MTKIPNPEQAAKHDQDPSEEPEGQVSEVSTMANAEDPIQPDQSVAGAPDDEDVDEGAQGPNANPNAGARRT
ncbi:hypothetical protein ENKNEFLB_03724 [Nocardioides aquaticus]|uniref:Uncharacterized protein n=1 Tax=Nocardioides aquaticus TaxID=160826 RepID=A0ABX8ENV0_9ACTN|nr:hypothetical protein [Nocardioides aquaticus]QVT81316.1 hypothetical protein ENKNEFLB_03724 [Nocardioides aquaticus]